MSRKWQIEPALDGSGDIIVVDHEGKWIADFKTREDAKLAIKAKELVKVLKEWREAHDWVSKNPEKLLSSKMSSDEAAEAMREYFNKETNLLNLAKTFIDLAEPSNIVVGGEENVRIADQTLS